MSLNTEFFERTTNISAKVIADSVNEKGDRITTLEVEYPRIVMSEFNTMRAISKNSSSSRAIPVSKMLDHTKNINLKPIYFGSKKSGMQAGEELVGEDLQYAKDVWESALKSAVGQASLLDECGVAKEVTNRLVEPFQLVKVVCTATDWDNFFNLRLHPDADPNICMLAYKMYKALEASTSSLLREGEWHLPYVEISQGQYDHEETYYYVWNKDTSGTETDGYQYEQRLTLEEAIKISTASCAAVSYRTEGMTLEKADKIFDILINAEVIHASPFEHLATPIRPYRMADKPYLSDFNGVDGDSWEDGVTHVNRQGQLCSGNLRGFISYRHLLPNNTSYAFDFNARMKMF